MKAQTVRIAPSVTSLPAFFQVRKYRAWRSQVEAFKTAGGLRALLAHVSEATWIGHYVCDEDSAAAVLDELEKIAD